MGHWPDINSGPLLKFTMFIVNKEFGEPATKKPAIIVEVGVHLINHRVTDSYYRRKRFRQTSLEVNRKMTRPLIKK